jgi:hypothetical protein
MSSECDVGVMAFVHGIRLFTILQQHWDWLDLRRQVPVGKVMLSLCGPLTRMCMREGVDVMSAPQSPR